ncbi:hypothetical protein PanWU01x14_176230 [Parasponia andersonii]|uniref:Uncharacterized protein n=1 Tax=Parasponia andersonii TaxID=3476 RepID=A0A2P5C842_PARAD|nr:hypothetical protein PanWU01x14_176230 [Parasponia andersonii]
MWEVLTGRRDGTVSQLTEAFANIPAPFLISTKSRLDEAAWHSGGSSIESIKMSVNVWQDLLCPKQGF